MKKIINYSGIPGLILISALFFLSVSCNKDTVENNPNADSNSQLIKVSGEDANAATKTTLSGLVTSWVANTDFVGIYSSQARTATSGGGSAIVNAKFTAANGGVSSNFTGTMFWGAASTSHTFYAYFPWTSGISAYTVVPISLPSAQTQSAANSNAHLGALDFMVATPVTVTSPANTEATSGVNLKYNHVFTVLEFQIKGTGQLKAVKLSGSNALAFSGGTIDITQTTPETGIYTITGQTGINHVEVTLTTPAPLSTTTTTVYMVINPGTQTGNCSIGLSSDGTNYLTISKEAPSGGFLRGKKYVVSIEADQDGNFFSTVTIGTQVWMAENLKTTKYRNGELIGTTTPATLDISAESSPKYQWAYDGNESNVATYGRLYTWYAATDSRNICPIGWHLPTDAEWTTLTTTYLGGESVAGGKLKETGTSHWLSPNTDATNTYGFTALPGGRRNSWSIFNNNGDTGYWWSSTEYSTTNAWYRYISYSYNYVARYQVSLNKTTGFSLRCVKGETAPYLSTTAVSAIASNSAISGGEISSDGGSSVTARGVCWSTAQNPTTSNTKTTDGSGIGSFTSLMSGLTPGTTYYVRAYATNSIGTTYGTQISFITGDTVSDNDGNTYNTVTIGTQVWMAENLKTTKYNDNTGISNVTDNGTWYGATTGACCDYENTSSNSTTYGKLYNWYAVDNNDATKAASNGGKNICPSGWQVPTDAEWTILTDYLGGLSVAGDKLKETGTTHWIDNTATATNSSGFTALPGGYRFYDGTWKNNIGTVGWWWSSSPGSGNAIYRQIPNYDSNVDSGSGIRTFGFSVRCVKQEKP